MPDPRQPRPNTLYRVKNVDYGTYMDFVNAGSDVKVQTRILKDSSSQYWKFAVDTNGGYAFQSSPADMKLAVGGRNTVIGKPTSEASWRVVFARGADWCRIWCEDPNAKGEKIFLQHDKGGQLILAKENNRSDQQWILIPVVTAIAAGTYRIRNLDGKTVIGLNRAGDLSTYNGEIWNQNHGWDVTWSGGTTHEIQKANLNLYLVHKPPIRTDGRYPIVTLDVQDPKEKRTEWDVRVIGDFAYAITIIKDTKTLAISLNYKKELILEPFNPNRPGQIWFFERAHFGADPTNPLPQVSAPVAITYEEQDVLLYGISEAGDLCGYSTKLEYHSCQGLQLLQDRDWKVKKIRENWLPPKPIKALMANAKPLPLMPLFTTAIGAAKHYPRTRYEQSRNRVFFQKEDMTIAVLLEEHNWSRGMFKSREALPGTAIEAVHVPSLGADGFDVFFQGKGHFIYRQTVFGGAFPAPPQVVTMDRAKVRTSIAVTSWDEGKQVRLYYQDAHGCIRELGCVDRGEWFEGGEITRVPIHAEICAASTSSGEVRLCIQGVGDAISEWVHYSTGWTLLDNRPPVLPRSMLQMALFAGYGKEQPRVMLLSKTPGYGRPIYETTQFPYYTLADTAYAFGYNLAVGDVTITRPRLGSSDSAAHFTDSEADTGQKFIQSVTVGADTDFWGYYLTFTDDTRTPTRGNIDKPRQWRLAKDDEIVQVKIYGLNRPRIQALQFMTSSGKSSPIFGTGTNDTPKTVDDLPEMMENNGQALVGFVGTWLKDLSWIMPLWSTRPPRVGSGALAVLNKEAEGLENHRSIVSGKIDDYKLIVPNLTKNLYDAIRAPLDKAIKEISNLGKKAVEIAEVDTKIEQLDKLIAAEGDRDALRKLKTEAEQYHAKRRTLIFEAKSIAVEANTDFDTVLLLGNRTRQKIDDLRTDIVYWESKADNDVKRIDEMIQIADASVTCARELRAVRQEAVDLHNRDVKAAREAKASAESKKRDYLEKKMWRDIFGGPLADILDIGGLNASIREVNAIIKEAEENEEKALAAAKVAQGRVDESDSELRKFATLKTRVKDLTDPLEKLRNALDGQRMQVGEVVTTAFDITIFLGNLYAYASPLDSTNSAATFAGQIEKMQKDIDTESKLSGPFLDNPHLVTQGLQAILDEEKEKEKAETLPGKLTVPVKS